MIWVGANSSVRFLKSELAEGIEEGKHAKDDESGGGARLRQALDD
jgi:hypothetical protein